jgi:HEPN domain-containing protein
MIDEKIKNWLIKAMEDIRTIEHEIKFSEEEMVTSTVCFHAQQAVEKLLKAFLVSKNVEFGKTHNLAFLLKLCSDQASEFSKLDVSKLTFYAIEVRYPILYPFGERG